MVAGLFVDKSIQNPGIPLVLYTILALDFLIPTLIFVINECSGRIEATRKKEGKLDRVKGLKYDLSYHLRLSLTPKSISFY